MRKLIISLALIAACRSTSTTSTTSVSTAPAPAPVMAGSQTGAPDGMTAVRAFMTAAKNQDIQTMSGLFGDTQGTARDRIPRDELDKRVLIMMCHLKHDRYDIVGDAPSANRGRSVVVNLVYGPLTRSTTFDVVAGPQNRWYVSKFDPTPLEAICQRKG